MKTKFIPLDYDYFDFDGRNYARIIGRDEKGKRICLIDECDIYFWAILKNNLNESRIKVIVKKIEKIKLEIKGRKTKVEKVEIHEKNFLGQNVKALKIFATNYKDLHDIADKLGMNEIEKRRGYDLGFISHYIIEKKLIPCYWYEITGSVLGIDDFGGYPHAFDSDIFLKSEEIKKMDLDSSDSLSGFKPKVLSYDIETDELKIGEGEILMISLYGEGFKKVITWKNTKSKSKKDYVEYVKDESELLEKFAKYVREISPDFLVGYFSDGFDMPYIKARAEENKVRIPLGLDESQPRFTRGGFELTGKIKGIVHIDILKFIRTAYSQYMQSETLSLNEVASEFLEEKKKDFKIKHSSKLNKEEWENYFEYNLQDSCLVFRLFEKVWPDILEFSRVMQEPIFEVTRNGMSKNVESFILHNLKDFNEIPEKRPTYDEIAERRKKGKYEGAFVFEPIPGIYENLAIFDFTSSYGSTIVTYNLSKSTFLKKKEKGSYSVETGGKKVYFSKKPGFFPEMLKKIIEKRKVFKEELKKENNAIKRARSNAFKLLANASYGYQGFFGARYYQREAAAATAAFARKSIADAIEKINEEGYETIYSDSVSGDTKIMVKKENKIYEKKIENLFEKTDSKNSLGKEYNFKKSTEVLTIDESGKSIFKPMEYVMRHKCDKKMYRVHFTNNWSIDITEDHSLIGYQSVHFNQTNAAKKNTLTRLIELKPEEIKNKANSIISLKKIPNNNPKSKNYPKKIYEFAGYFIGDGSFMPNKEKKDYYLRLSLGKDGKEVFNNLIIPLKKKGFVKNCWWSKSRKGDLTVNGLNLVRLISQDFKNGSGKKIIPEWMFEEKEENIAAFLRGLFSADGTVMMRNNVPIIKYTSINDDFIINTRKLLYRVGISNSVFKDNTQNKFGKYSSGSHSKNILIKDREEFANKIGFLLKRKNKKAEIRSKSIKKRLIKDFEFDIQGVKKIERIKSPEYVYDIEIKDNHRFFANYVLVHNTDSIAFLLNGKTEKQTEEFLKKLNEKLPGIMELELEGFFSRGLWVMKRSGNLGAKKKYALITKEGKLKIRGFETVRRDWCQLARRVQNNVIKMVLEDGSEKKALDYTKEIIKKLKRRDVNKEDLIIRTQLKKAISEYKAISPHVIAARKMQEAKMPISQGNLIEYFIAEPQRGEKRKLIRDRVMLPGEKGDYDIEYYLEHQILPAVENIFHVFGIE
ncbi:hypothetical protein COU59_00735, partial [Candidatus Pacearchaeota archaeon CG10_big_fil_rev_8_21_14_0_10_34_12]